MKEDHPSPDSLQIDYMFNGVKIYTLRSPDYTGIEKYLDGLKSLETHECSTVEEIDEIINKITEEDVSGT